MKEKIMKIGSYVLVAVLAAVLATAAAERGRTVSKLDQLEGLIDSRFIGEADPAALEDAAAAAMVKATGDRWSYYIPAGEYAAYEERTANAYVGIGITIMRAEDETGFQVLSVTPGSPAEESGVMAGDLLVQVEGQSVADMDAADVHKLVRGEEGSYVSLVFLRTGDALSVSAERRKIESPVAVYELLDNQIGLVTIANFDDRCAEETLAAIEALRGKGAEKLIFDVRNNPGGYAHEMVKVLDYLLPAGDLFRTVTYDGRENVDTSDAKYLDMPMAVIVNGSSYSAAEFFAAALQEYGAAIVVGENTTGKGYFQSTYRLSDGSAVALSIGKYFTPKGVSLADVGITPDVRSLVDEETAGAIYNGTLASDKDPQIQAAVRALMEKK